MQAYFNWRDVMAKVLEKAEISSRSYSDIDSDEIERFKACGEQLIALFDDVLRVLENSKKSYRIRDITIYRDYLDSNKVTLAALGLKYDVSRERIRQIVNRRDIHVRRFFKRILELALAHVNKEKFLLTNPFHSLIIVLKNPEGNF